MFSHPHTIKHLINVFFVLILILSLIPDTQYAQANFQVSSFPHEEIAGSTDGADDAILEVGLHWINDYPYYAMINADASCQGFNTILNNEGWITQFMWGNSQAWERDYKASAFGGLENITADGVDIAMLCALGWEPYDAVLFSSLRDDYYLTPLDALESYGDNDLEWLAFHSSGVLDNDSRSDWASTMNGLHLLLGFKNQAYYQNQSLGEIWAEHMLGDTGCIAPSSVTQAWLQAVDETQPSSTCARVLGKREVSYNDYLWGKGFVSNDISHDNEYYYWDHCSTGDDTMAASVDDNQPKVLTMPKVQVQHRTIDQDYVENIIAPAFEFENENFCMLEDKFTAFRVLDGETQTLQVDRLTGSYSFYNLTKLWNKPDVPPSLPSADISDVRINIWLNSPAGLLLPASSHAYRNAGWEYMVEDIVGMHIINGSEEEISRLSANVAMTYPRKLAISAVTTNGIELVDFPVFGPGARFKAYLGDESEIIGVQGGSRDISVLTETIQTLDVAAAWGMFLADHSLAIGGMPYEADLITNSGIGTLGYYEMPYAMGQDYLIPVWMFSASFYSTGYTIASDVPLYIPAALEYLPPTVEILNPVEGAEFSENELISFEGLVSGGTPPYTYEWTSSSDGYLGNSLNIVSTIGSSIRSSTVYNTTITFRATDTNGLTNSATITLTINPIVWLPLIAR